MFCFTNEKRSLPFLIIPFLILLFLNTPLVADDSSSASKTRAASHAGGTSTLHLQSTSEHPNQKYLEQCADERPRSAASTNSKKDKVDSKNESLAKEVQAIFSARAGEKKQCTDCHNGELYSGGVYGFSPEELKKKLNLEKPEESKLYQAIIDERMPPEGEAKPLSEVEKNKVLAWIKAGVPEVKKDAKEEAPNVGFISEADKYLCIEKDLRRVAEADRPYVRYFSLTHLYNQAIKKEGGTDNQKVERINDNIVAINLLLNSLAPRQNKLKLPTQVDSLGTLLRIDLRDYKWGAVSGQKSREWELIKEQNPYAVKLSPGPAKDAYEKVFSQIHESTFDVNGDWFVANGSQGELYFDLLDLPGVESSAGSDKRFLEFFHAVEDPEHHEDLHFSVGLGPGESGVSLQNNRLFHRGHLVDKDDKNKVGGYYYASSDFDKSTGEKNAFENPEEAEKHKNGGETIVGFYKESDAGKKMAVQFYSLNGRDGGRLTNVSSSNGIVSHEANKRHNRDVFNAVSCMDCHDRLKKEQGIITPAHGNPLAEHLRDRHAFSRTRNKANKVDLSVLDDFKPVEEILPIYKKDQELYRNFQEAVGGKFGIRPRSVFKVFTRYENDMDEKAIASELHVPLEGFKKVFDQNPDLKRKFPLKTVGSIPRESFLAEFNHLVELTGVGERAKREAVVLTPGRYVGRGSWSRDCPTIQISGSSTERLTFGLGEYSSGFEFQCRTEEDSNNRPSTICGGGDDKFVINRPYEFSRSSCKYKRERTD